MSRHRRPSDAERIWAELCQRPYRLHSLEMRERGLTGNPSQRIAELEEIHGVTIPRVRAEWRNGRRGVLYFHPDHPPTGLRVGGAAAQGRETHRGCMAPGRRGCSAAGPEAGGDGPQADVTDLFAASGQERPDVPLGSYRDPDAEGPVAA